MVCSDSTKIFIEPQCKMVNLLKPLHGFNINVDSESFDKCSGTTSLSKCLSVY